MILKNDVGTEPYLECLQDLFIECFDEPYNPKSDYRFIKAEQCRIISHASMVKRSFDINLPLNTESYLLGYVGVRKSHRKQGLGKRAVEELLWSISDQNYAILLNCSEFNRPFYEKLGFRQISGKSIVLRGNEKIVDVDPVMILFKNKKRDPGDYYESIFFGEEY
jgi:predicted N-acetyltransferase YhbS